ncbi:hypothetical protein [Actinospica sp.]|uniref:hypothetical protein n=1 Tax=Actinospica sp. TaxID=1872142 RepID=UPI002CF3D944|nr:hypothetical protein [Actinospica sp.]HWG24241.1 hypothetical protein [Actinospica sp.]
MHAYERIEDGQYRSHETVQLFGWTPPVTCLCGLTSDQLTRLVIPGGTRAKVDDCAACGPRRAERYVDVRASEGDPWHSIARSDPSRTLCSVSAGDGWAFYRPTGRPPKAARCASCEQVRAPSDR